MIFYLLTANDSTRHGECGLLLAQLKAQNQLAIGSREVIAYMRTRVYSGVRVQASLKLFQCVPFDLTDEKKEMKVMNHFRN